MKSVAVFTRKDGITRKQFQDYYESNHAPLGIQHFPFGRYVRNHVHGAPEVEIETISEFWADDLADLAEPLRGPVGAIMAEDEARFMRRDRTSSRLMDERILSGGDPTDGAGMRSVALARWQAEDAAAALASLRTWASAVAEQQPGVTLDLVAPPSGSVAFPADALLWLPDFDGAPEPPGVLDVTALRVRRHETPSTELVTAFWGGSGKG